MNKSLNSISQHLSIAWAAFIIALIATLLSWSFIKNASQQHIRSTIFDYRVEQVKNAIVNRMFTYQQVLAGGVGLFAASDSVERQKWHDYVENLHLHENYPGIQGIGFSQWVLPQDKVAHIAQVQAVNQFFAEGFFQSYQIKPQGERAEYSPIVYLEPLDQRNQQAIGYDMFSEPIRRIAMERARDSGQAALSGKVTLVQEIDEEIQAGCLLYFPVYRSGQPHETVDERRAALIGFVFSPFRVNDLMRGIFGNQSLGIDYEIYDSNSVDDLNAQKLMYDAVVTTEPVSVRQLRQSPFGKIEQIQIAGQTWTILFSALPKFELTMKTYTPNIVLIGGIVMSLLLFGTLRSLETQQLLIIQQRANVRLQAEIHERQQIEQVLRQRDADLQEIQRMAHVGSWSLNVATQQVFWSEEVYKTFGLDPELPAPDYTVHSQLFPPESWERLNTHLSHTIATGLPYEIELEVIKADGSRGWMVVRGESLRNENGAVVKLYGMTLDITQRKLAEISLQKQHEMLQASEQKLQTLFNILGVGLSITDEQGNIIDCNQSSEIILGVSKEEHLHRNYAGKEWHIIHPDFTVMPPEEFASVRALKEKTVINNIEMGLVKANDEITWILVSATPMNLKGYGVVISYFDISARKQIEKALRESEERFDLAMRGSNDGLWDWDLVTGKVYRSSRFKQIFGLTEEGMGTQFDEFTQRIHPNDREHFEMRLKSYLNKESPQYEMIFQLQHQDGHYFWGLGRAFAVWNEAGKPIRMVGVLTDITTLKQTELALDNQRHLLQTILDTLPAGVHVYEATSGKTLLANNYSEKLLRRSVEPMVALDNIAETYGLFLYGTDEFYPINKLPLTRALSGETSTADDVEIQRADGTRVLLQMTAAPMRNTNGQVVASVVICHDITRRRHMEKLLIQSEQRFISVLDSLPAFVYLCDEHYSLHFTNRVFRKRFGNGDNGNSSITKCCYVAMNHVTEPCAICPAARVFNNPLVSQTVENVLFDGRIYEMHYHPFIDRDGTLLVLGMGLDITERKQLEQKLRDSEAFNVAVLDSLNDQIAVLDPQGVIIHVNRAWRQFGAENGLPESYNGLLGFNYLEVCANAIHCPGGEQAEFVLAGIKAVLSGEQTQFMMEYTCHSPHEKRWVNMTVLPLQGRLLGVVVSHEDITLHKKMEEFLRQTKEQAEMANRAKSIFLANMSHELRTPLNSVLGYAQILVQDHTLTDDQRQSIHIIEQNGEYLLTLINDVLDLAKVEAGKVELSPTVVELEELLQGITHLFALRAEQKNLTFSYEYLTTLPFAIYADERKLRQVIINLLGNAFKFTQVGYITLKVAYEEETLYFQVEDSGCGIASADLDKIFDPFQQVGQKEPQKQGTGLGLAITKGLVETMRGHLQVSSVLGQGSIFSMSFKLPEAPVVLQSPHTVELPKIIGYQGERRTVLIIDDNATNREILIKMLTHLGFTVSEAENGRAGLHKVHESSPFDVILVDLVMPELNGLAVIEQLKRLAQSQKSVLIAISASAFEADRQRSLELGCHAFVAKPIKFDILLECLRVHLNLTWLYEQKPTTATQEFSLSDLASVQLTPEQADELLELTKQGDIMEICYFAEQLEQNDEKLAAFARYLHELATQFKVGEIRKISQKFSNS